MTKYEDITIYWIKSANPNTHEVKNLHYFIDKSLKVHIVDNKKVILNYSNKELEIANWLENTFGGEIYMVPKINYPKNIKTPDYLWNREYWDLKEIKKSGKRVIDNRINNTKDQTNNYILDCTGNDLSNDELIYQIKRLYNSPERKWVDKIILVRNYKIIKIYKRKKVAPSQ